MIMQTDMKGFFYKLIIAAGLLFYGATSYANAGEQVHFYIIKLHKEINSSSARMMTDALRQAQEKDADYCIIDLNTYGGALDAADSIRTAILRHPIPVIAFINNQAASAGALISIACDSIYMSSGSSIGAATVVDGSGNVLPDKYQSFMRAMMRSTAECHPKRDPEIAQAMVSADSVLSFTPTEAIASNYCEGMAENISQAISQIIDTENTGYTITEHRISALSKIIYFFLNPYIQGLLLMLIIGGIYFELQSPGIGFPLIAAIVGVVLYFTPLYLEGFVQNWEIIFFFVGIILLMLEIFVIPGFGIAGISGFTLIIVTLAFAMIDNDIVFTTGDWNLKPLVKPFAIVLVSTTSMLFISIYLAAKLFPSRMFSRISLNTDLSSGGKEGFVGVEKESLNSLVGKECVVANDLKPQGYVEIEGKIYQATLETGYAQRGEKVKIFRHEGGRLYCKKDIK